MTREPVPSELKREYTRARNIGALIDIVLPLGAAIGVVLLGGVEIGSLPTETTEIQWLKYGLVVFSVSVCIAARAILGRLMGDARKMARLGICPRGRVFYSYLALFALYLVPAIWGFAFFVLSRDLIAFFVLGALTALAFLFLTPAIEQFWEDRPPR